MARPPLPRYRVTLHLDIDLSAEGIDDADDRLARLFTDLRPRLSTLVGARRVGACELVNVTASLPAPAPDPEPLPPCQHVSAAGRRHPAPPIDEPLLERLTATREDLAP